MGSDSVERIRGFALKDPLRLMALLVVLGILWVLLFCFALSKVGEPATLTCTIPSHGQLRYYDPAYGPDSMMIECSGGDSVHVDSLRLYRYDSGNFRLYRSYYVRGREGGEFSTDSLPPGQYEMRAWNHAGESCGGNVATVPGTTTGVPTGEVKAPGKLPGLGRLYDVRGRLVHGRPAAGIYFTKEKKRVVVNSRGEIISR